MSAGAPPRTLFEKIWDAHRVAEAHGRTLLYVDRNYVHEGSRHAFAALAAEGRDIWAPQRTIAFADHYVPTQGRPLIADPQIRSMVEALQTNASRHGMRHIGLDDPRQGIVHVVAPELGLTLPGMFVACADSHVPTHGALGALTCALGTSQLKHVLATQTIWQRRPRTMRITIDGVLGPGISAKDLALAIIAQIGANGAAGHVVEYAGSGISALPMAGRFTLCNMSTEMGARSAFIAPDETISAYLAGCTDSSADSARWSALRTDEGAAFDSEITLPGETVQPMVTWGTSPEDAVPITGYVPDPSHIPDLDRRTLKERALRYMGLTPGMAVTDIGIDRVFIGSCTNARLDDLRAAARVLEGRKVCVPGIVVPGSGAVKRQAEAEGLDAIFRTAGLEWREPGCSMCVGVNGDLLRPGERCASTSNRNFEGRQGIGTRTHLVSPAMAAAAALAGHLTDVRRLEGA
jgi:3-isopropylmalate/(R)-2-methylmalate dehydratase large subunit